MRVPPGYRAAGGVIAVVVILMASVLFSLEDFDWVALVALGLWLLTTAVVGGLIIAARPGHAVGSLMMWTAIAVAFTTLLLPTYATYAFGRDPSSPLTRWVAWWTLWTTIPAFTLFIHLVLRFPTGRVPSPGWRWVSRAAVVGAVLASVGYAFKRGRVDVVPELSNPAASLVPEWVSSVGITVGDSLLPVAGFLSLASLFVRYRTAATRERQQMKWFIFSASLFPVMFLISQLVQFADDSEEEYLGFLLIVVALLFVPISMGIGILKHRLYDIDVVLNRALVYGALTGILGLAYLSIVVLLQRILEPLTRQSDVAVAGSTLAVAALFRPARARVQSFIDQRFYRRKYDAAEALDQFSTRLRDQVDLDALNRELVGVVGRTMQPAHASLWVRGGTGR